MKTKYSVQAEITLNIPRGCEGISDVRRLKVVKLYAKFLERWDDLQHLEVGTPSIKFKVVKQINGKGKNANKNKRG